MLSKSPYSKLDGKICLKIFGNAGFCLSSNTDKKKQKNTSITTATTTLSLLWSKVAIGSLRSYSSNQFALHICVESRGGNHSCVTYLGQSRPDGAHPSSDETTPDVLQTEWLALVMNNPSRSAMSCRRHTGCIHSYGAQTWPLNLWQILFLIKIASLANLVLI